MTLKEKVMGVAAALLFSLGMASTSQAVLIDFDGTGSQTTTQDYGSLDWNATSFVAQGGQTAVANFINSSGSCPSGGCTFTVSSQGSLQGATDTNGNPIGIGGLNIPGTGFQITYVAKITETVTGFNAGTNTASFATNAGSTGFVDIYFSPVNSSQLSGQGFNDGTLILHATIVGSSTGDFTISNATATTLDNFTSDGNNYGTQQSITGQGSTTTIPFSGLTTNSDFFKSALAVFGIEFSNLSQSLPFNSVDPMACFVTTDLNQTQCSTYSGLFTNGQPYSAQVADANGGFIPKVGAINSSFCGDPTTSGGLTTIGSTCPDFVAQTDPNSPLRAAVPEPASMLLFGFGLVGLSVYSRRRTTKD